MMAQWAAGWAAHQPDKPAIVHEGGIVTYAGLARRIERAAAALSEAGVGRGDRVAQLGLNSPDTLVLLFACARLGAILVTLNWRLTPAELQAIVGDCTPKLGWIDPDFAAALPDLPRLASLAGNGPAPAEGQDDDGVLLVYTSGTTGRPKGALLTQRALTWNAINGLHANDLTAADRVLTVLPMFHVGGLNIQTTPALFAGATVVLERRFTPEGFCAALAAHRPSLTLLVPAVMQALLRHPDFAMADLSCLRLIMTGSSTVPAALIDPFHARGVPVGQVYGSTETGPTAICLRADRAMAKIGSCGAPAPHVDVRVVDEAGHDVADGVSGEILVRGPNVMAGYWNDPGATAAALEGGWYRTGDIGHRDADGCFWIDDRKKDVVISGGENIYPAELEAVLAACEGIAEATVVGRADPRWGEVPVAVVVSALTEAEILGLFEGRLARYKHPRAVAFVDRLPRNVMGKVLKHEVRTWLGG